MTASEAIFNWNMVISLLFNCSLLGSSNTEVGKAGAAAAQPTQGYIDKDDIPLVVDVTGRESKDNILFALS